MKVKQMTFSSMIAAIYFLLCFVEQDFASGAIQCRISEGLTLLPLFFPEAIIGVTLGCLIFNIVYGTLFDIIFGTLATLLAGVITYFIGKVIKNDYLKILIGGIPPIIINALVIPLILIFSYNSPDNYFYLVLTVGIGQFIAVYVVGFIIYFPFKKMLTYFNIN